MKQFHYFSIYLFVFLFVISCSKPNDISNPVTQEQELPGGGDSQKEDVINPSAIVEKTWYVVENSWDYRGKRQSEFFLPDYDVYMAQGVPEKAAEYTPERVVFHKDGTGEWYDAWGYSDAITWSTDGTYNEDGYIRYSPEGCVTTFFRPTIKGLIIIDNYDGSSSYTLQQYGYDIPFLK